uniref:Fucosyltransferase n=1 Tax=Zea mays TaxID=4577 RepID=A0A804QZN9_MAIZE
MLPASRGAKKSRAVLVTSLKPWYQEKVRSMYWEHATATGEVMSILQPTQRDVQDHPIRRRKLLVGRAHQERLTGDLRWPPPFGSRCAGRRGVDAATGVVTGHRRGAPDIAEDILFAK